MTVGRGRPTVFLSDLHFAGDGPPAARRLLARLDSFVGTTDAVYLVGDVFDFWLGYRAAIFHPHLPLIRRLEALVASGTRVVLFAGNHDPDPGPLFEQLGVEVHEGPLGIELGEHRVWLEHGDLIDPRGWHHRAVCRAVRHPATRAVARLVPPDLLWGASRIYARKPHRYTSPLPRGLIERWFPARVAEGYDVAVIGHYHRAVRHEVLVEGRVQRLFALGDWRAQFTWLRYDGQFNLLRDLGPGREPQRLPLGDHAPGEPAAANPAEADSNAAAR